MQPRPNIPMPPAVPPFGRPRGCLLLLLAGVGLKAGTLNLLVPENKDKVRICGQAMEAPLHAFDEKKPSLSLSRAGQPVQSCLLSVPLGGKGTAPVRLAQAGDTLGLRLGISYRPWTGPAVSKGPRMAFALTPWGHDQKPGLHSSPAGSAAKIRSWGLLTGQGNEIANFWLRPEGGKNLPTSSQDGSSAGSWPKGVLSLPAWKSEKTVEVIFSLTRLENGGLRYYGFCGGIEHQNDVPAPAPLEADFLWLDLSSWNSREVLLTELEIRTP